MVEHPTYLGDCPRCNAKKITFDCYGDLFVGTNYEGKTVHELLVVCRHCNRGSVHLVSVKIKYNRDFRFNNAISSFVTHVNDSVKFIDHITLKDRVIAECPQHLPQDVEAAFQEGQRCMSGGCFNAAAAMFRLALDRSTEPLLPAIEESNGPNSRQRRDLGLRLPWLIKNGKLPSELKELADCVKEEGNDGTHRGTVDAGAAEDLHEFSHLLLTRMFAEPTRLKIAEDRRASRRKQQAIGPQ